MQECIQSYQSTIEERFKAQSKIRQYEEDIAKINSGGKSIKNLFKSSSRKQVDIQNLKNSIETTETIVLNYKKIINILTVYLSEIALPQFKEDKIKTYCKVFSEFSMKEIQASHLNVTFWTNVHN